MDEQQNPQGMKALIPESGQKQTPPAPPQLPGPVFKNEPGWGAKLGNWLRRNFARKALIVIAIAAVVIIVVMLSGKEGEESLMTLPEETGQVTEEVQPEETAKVVLEESEAGDVYTVEAQAGEGITHLARKALKEYLDNNSSAGSGLTAEHKIYIEDFLKDQNGERMLMLGEELDFSAGDIAEAIGMARGLSDSQLANLSQYVPLVSGL